MNVDQLQFIAKKLKRFSTRNRIDTERRKELWEMMMVDLNRSCIFYIYLKRTICF